MTGLAIWLPCVLFVYVLCDVVPFLGQRPCYVCLYRSGAPGSESAGSEAADGPPYHWAVPGLRGGGVEMCVQVDIGEKGLPGTEGAVMGEATTLAL